jgi:hypothetical protein
MSASLDAVDQAFLFHADKMRRQQPSPMPSPPSPGLPEQRDGYLRGGLADDGQGTLVERLLRVVPDAWARLARRVEEARHDGVEVIAVAGGRRGEGRTTLVECLARTLAARGRHVESHESVPPELPAAGRDGGRIVLVDAGVWFPGGPLRRAWLERQSLGCHAVILVRRSDQPACAARTAALEAVGLEVLGEVLTMAPPATSGIQVS